DYVSYALALEALAHASASVSVIASVNNSLVTEPLAHFGSGTQKETWLRRLASGEILGAFALSEEQAGGGAANQQNVGAPRPPPAAAAAASARFWCRSMLPAWRVSRRPTPSASAVWAASISS